MIRRSIFSILSLLISLCVLSCSASKQFDPIPKNLDREKTPRQTFDMTAERFHYTPDEIHVKQGTLLTLRIKSIQATHGFSIGEFGIDLTLDEGVTNTIEIYLPQKGEYTYRCSHFCGIGHPWMKGTLYVE